MMAPMRKRLLGDLLDGSPVRGRSQDTDGADGMIPWIPTGQVTGGSGVVYSTPDEMTSNMPRERLTQKGDLLLAIRGVEKASDIGCSSIEFKEPAAYAQSLMRLRVNPEVILADYLRAYLTSEKGRIALSGAATGTVISNVSAAALERIEVLLPDLATQAEIVETLQKIEFAVEELGSVYDTAADFYRTMKEGITSGIIPPSGDLDKVVSQ